MRQLTPWCYPAAVARKKPPPRGPQLDLSGALCVAFVNTAGARKGNRQQGVKSYADLLRWGLQAGLIQALDAERLGRLAAEPEAAEAAFARAAEARSCLFRLFLAVMAGSDLPEDDLAILNAAAPEAMAALRLVPGERGLTVGWGGDAEALDRVLWPVLYSAVELLLSLEGLPHVRQCAAKGCTLFFVDRSATGQRRWCDMKTCGNRAKALRYYYRTARAERDETFRGSGEWKTKRPRPRS